MRIGIITFHDGINHGALLQVLCLQEHLKETGHEVDIINYKGKAHHEKEMEHFLKFKPYFSKNPKKFIQLTKKRVLNYAKIQKFKRTHALLNLTKFIHDIRDLDTSVYDVVVLGSDEIWNFHNPLSGLDLTYFGEGLKSKKIISYAPSFGAVNFGVEIPDFIQEALKGLDEISVRDKNSKEIVEGIGLKAEKVLDPTFLHHVESEFVPKVSGSYMLVYLNHVRAENVERLKAFAASMKLTLVAISYEMAWCDHSFISLNIFEWIGFFKHASYVVTNTFHGCIYSLLHKKDFIILDAGKKSNKIHSLLSDLSLTDLICQTFNESGQSLEYPIDYKKVDNIIDQHRRSSVHYLKRAIGS